MADRKGGLSEKDVTAWFDALSFEKQGSLMQALSSSHSKLRADRIAKLRAELAALEGNSDGSATANGTIASASVKPKYRNPATGEVWSGRGRMAGWLAAKVKAGEKAQRYLVK
jgi:DNA-binding protein H-NS